MSFWNLYTEQSKVPVYITTDYSKRGLDRKESTESSTGSEKSELVMFD